jgi:flagellar biosynthetic protein FliP
MFLKKKGFRLFFTLSLATLLFFSPELFAQNLNISLGNNSGTVAGNALRLVALVTVLSLAPSILLMMTAFTRIVIVLSILRNALGTQQSPPNSVMISLALFLTMFVMAPTFEKAYNNGIDPLIKEKIKEGEAIKRTYQPFHEFMLFHARKDDIKLFAELAGQTEAVEPENLSPRILIPAFMISDLRRGFEIGFLIFLPFLIIDMIIASILMSMGMMMLPPVVISLPFKIIFFVIIDGWHMLSESLVKSFGT